MIKALLFDLTGTLYDGDTGELYPETIGSLAAISPRYTSVLVTELSEGKKGLIERLGIASFFDRVVISRKTEELFLSIMRDYGLKPSECLVIGDGATNELSIAQKLGIPYFRIGHDPSDVRTIASVGELESRLCSYTGSGARA